MSSEKTPELTAEQFQALLEHSQREAAGTGKDFKFTSEETKKFKTAFDDPQFRKMFTEYIDEMQDPKNRAENEAYITQLEGEKKVPEGKELIRPTAAFAAKAKKKMLANGDIDKLFINIVQSDRIVKPSKKSVEKGEQWTLPSVLGPPHMEKDKSESNATAFDCCFHPDAIAIANKNERFRDLLVQTALDLILEFYKRANQKVELVKMEKESKDGKKKKSEGSDMFHILQGVSYKTGSPPTMLVAIENLDIHNKAVSELKTGNKSSVNTGEFSQADIAFANPVDKKKSSTDSASASKAISSTSATSAKTDAKPPPAAVEVPRNHNADLKPVQGTTVVKRGFLNTGPQNGSNGLIQEIKSVNFDGKNSSNSGLTNSSSNGSSNKSSINSNNSGSSSSSSSQSSQSSLMTPISSKPLENAANSNDNINNKLEIDSKIPGYTLIERAAVEMGDFNGSKNVKSSRPSEIVIKFQLPLVKKASDVVLDVARRSVKLQYEDKYDCTVNLSYPVFDLKGSAKFDKTAKTLTVTIPVVPFKQEEVEAVESSVSGKLSDATKDEEWVMVDNESGDKNELVKEVNTGRTNNDSNNNTAEKSSDSKPVPASSTPFLSGLVENPLSNKSLKDRIAEESRLAKEKYEQEQKEKANAPPTPPSQGVKKIETNAVTPPPSPPPVVESKNDSSSSDDGIDAPNFIACQQFGQKTAGYYFGLGKQGLGYYKDLKDKYWASVAKSKSKSDSSASSSLESKSSSNPSSAVVAMPLPKFESRSLKDCSSVLIQVANVVPLSVHLEFDEKARMAHVLFRELRPTNKDRSLLAEDEVYNIHAFSLKLIGNSSIGKCDYDVSSSNVAIIFDKSSPSSEKMAVEIAAYSGRRAIGEFSASTIPLQKALPVLVSAPPSSTTSTTNPSASASTSPSSPTTSNTISSTPLSKTESPQRAPSKESIKLQEMMANMSFSTSSTVLDLD